MRHWGRGGTLGVHDYVCSVCGAPTTYDCREADGGECGPEGFGSDAAHVDLYFFAGPGPRDAAAFAASRGAARRALHRRYAYDWGAWEFVPPLNYRDVAMDGDESRGAWVVSARGADPGHEPELEVPAGEVVWAEVTCVGCHERFVQGAGSGAPCREWLRAVSAQTRLPFDEAAGKDAFVATVRAHLGDRPR